MAMTKKDIFALTAGAILLVGISAGAGAYYVNSDDDAAQSQQRAVKVSHNNTNPTDTAPATTVPACDDDNIVGKVLGGAAGGIAGSQIGSGNGKTAATIGGSVGGTLLGEEYIPTKNVTCR